MYPELFLVDTLSVGSEASEVEALLIVGVSKTSNIQREEIVKVIMTMDPSVQAQLMR